MTYRRFMLVTTALYIAVLFCLTACLGGRQPAKLPDASAVTGPLVGAHTDGVAVKGAVHTAATQVGTSAQQVVADGKAGMEQTQPDGPKADNSLWTLFSRITNNGFLLVEQGSKLNDIESRIDTLNAKVDQGSKAFDKYKADTVLVLAAKDDTISKQAKHIESLESTFTTWVHLLMLAVTLIFAANIAICFMAQDFKIAVCVGIGCIIALVSLIIISRVYEITFEHVDQIIWALGIGLGVCVVWFVIDVLCRGSIAAALKSSPVEDVKDAISKFAPHLLEPVQA